ncbi:hypothetical protein [Moheibacter sediminis]|nr:hypothetical protein [Moheibacter sediminis]
MESLNFKFKTIDEIDENSINSEFLKEHNLEINEAEKAIYSGQFISKMT